MTSIGGLARSDVTAKISASRKVVTFSSKIYIVFEPAIDAPTLDLVNRSTNNKIIFFSLNTFTRDKSKMRDYRCK